MTTIEDLLREYSSQPERLRLPRAYPLEAAMPGITVLSVPANPLALEATALRTRVEQRKQVKGQKPSRRQVEYLLVHRCLERVDYAAEGVPPLLGPLTQVPDCSHSHLVLELNILAFLLKLPAHVQLGCYVHFAGQRPDEEPRKPELITVQRVPDLTRDLLNDAFQRRKRAATQREHTGLTQEAAADPAGTGATRATDTDDKADSHTGGAGDAGGSAAPCGAAEVQSVSRRLQQQELFAL